MLLHQPPDPGFGVNLVPVTVETRLRGLLLVKAEAGIVASILSGGCGL